MSESGALAPDALDVAAPSSEGRPPGQLRLELRNITKTFGSIRALDGVSVTFRGGEIHGLCGHNGAGKSTLMKVMMGLVTPDEGELLMNGEPAKLRNSEAAHQAGLTIVDQELGLVPLLSIEENLFLGNVDEPFFTRRRTRRARARELLADVGLEEIDLRTPLAALLPGQRKLVELAHVLGHKARMMILDEPTASLSHGEARRVFAAAKRAVAAGAGVIFVSHRLDEVFEICQSVTVMRDGKLVATQPIERIDRGALVEMMVGDVVEGGHKQASERRGPAVRISELSVPPRVRRVDLDLPAGKIVGLAGQVGSGASDVLRALAGLEELTSGKLRMGEREVRLAGPARMSREGVHYVSNDRKAEGLFLEHSIETNLTATRLASLGRFGFLGRHTRARAASELSKQVAVRSSGIGQRVGELSGGNQQKVLIGRCLGGPGGELLLLDDPTRGVDVEGRAEIHELVRQAAERNAVLFVSTELDELMDLADVIVTVRDGSVVAVHGRGDVRAQQVLGDMTHAGEQAAA